MPIELREIVHREKKSEENVIVNVDRLMINDGEFVGVIAAQNENSKPLARLIAEIEKPEFGEVSVSYMGERVRCAFFDSNGEKCIFNPTVESEVASGICVSLSSQEKASAVKKAIELVGFDADKVKALDPLTLSRGEKRLVYLASVLVNEPKILVLDEPLADMDGKWRTALMELLRKLNSNGTTVVLFTDDSSCLSQYARRIIIMKNGGIYMDSSAKNVFSEYYELVHLGIEIPEIKSCIRLLREKGMEMPDNIILYDQFIDRLKVLMWRKNR